MKTQPSRTMRLFEVLFLRPFNIAFPILAIACFIYGHWVAGVAMGICWLLVGAIGQSLPHRKPETFSELKTGETLLPTDDGLSNEDALALAKATMRLGATVGFAALVLTWSGGLRWYWILLAAVGGYFITAMTAGIVPALIASLKVRPGPPGPSRKLIDEQWNVAMREFKRVHQSDETRK